MLSVNHSITPRGKLVGWRNNIFQSVFGAIVCAVYNLKQIRVCFQYQNMNCGNWNTKMPLHYEICTLYYSSYLDVCVSFLGLHGFQSGDLKLMSDCSSCDMFYFFNVGLRVCKLR